MAYSIEKFKKALLAQKNTNVLEEITDDKGIEFMKITKDLSFMDLTVRVHIEDIVDDQIKAALMQAAFAALQAQVIDFKDYTTVIKARTYKELDEYFARALDKKERQAAQQQAMQELMSLVKIGAQNEGLRQIQAEKMQGEAAMQEQKLTVDAGIEGAKMQQQMLMDQMNQQAQLPLARPQ